MVTAMLVFGLEESLNVALEAIQAKLGINVEMKQIESCFRLETEGARAGWIFDCISNRHSAEKIHAKVDSTGCCQ